MGQLDEGEVLIEYYRVGAYVKVSAIDPATRTEVSIVGDPKRSEAELARVALNKLKVRHVQTGGGADPRLAAPRCSGSRT